MAALAKRLQLSHQAIRKWQIAGRMPRTEWTGDTTYAQTIEEATAGRVTKAQLLAKWPVYVPRERAPRINSLAPLAERAAASEFARSLLQREIDRITHAAAAPPSGRREKPGQPSKDRISNHREGG